MCCLPCADVGRVFVFTIFESFPRGEKKHILAACIAVTNAAFLCPWLSLQNSRQSRRGLQQPFAAAVELIKTPKPQPHPNENININSRSTQFIYRIRYATRRACAVHAKAHALAHVAQPAPRRTHGDRCTGTVSGRSRTQNPVGPRSGCATRHSDVASSAKAYAHKHPAGTHKFHYTKYCYFYISIKKHMYVGRITTGAARCVAVRLVWSARACLDVPCMCVFFYVVFFVFCSALGLFRVCAHVHIIMVERATR